MKASERYVMKAADAYKSDIDIPFTFRNNVALILQKVQNGVPTETQAKELINHMTRAITLVPECDPSFPHQMLAMQRTLGISWEIHGPG